ncbi:MAG TPA: SpoIIE family protein phosphatase [Blastococcus sp.]|jgi:signal transduction histidine kinase/CheY-like chemotaxis protein|nr:SpoIIE family protein phosphatase [Blastococcus sp.]
MTASARSAFPAELLTSAPDSGMNALMVATDWSVTSLGPVTGWPTTLRTAVSICLNSRFPMLIWWGPELAMLYNDAYVPILGTKHPASLGKPGARVWADVWPVVGEMLAGVLTRGAATYSEDLLLVMERHAFTEEAYFTFSYSPILGADGRPDGVFTAVTETTARVLSTRRLATLQALGGVRATQTGDVGTACKTLLDVLGGSRADLPFGAVYLTDADGAGVRFAARYGLRDDDVLPTRLPRGDISDWVWDAVRTGERTTSDGVADRRPGLVLPGASPAGDADVDVAVALPLTAVGHERPLGALVVGVSPYLRLDDDYASFLELVAGQVTAAVVDARAYETERHRAEELAALDRAKSEFFANVSHELRTPLALISAPVEDALADVESPLPPAQRTRLEVVARNAGRLRRMVDTLLDFSRIEEGRLTPELVPVDLAALTRGIAESFAPAVLRAGLTLELACPDEDEPVLVDPEMWEKIVLNLLSNAVKFTPAGEVRLTLRTGPDEVRLDVADTGIGIPADELPRVFERFHRVRGSSGRSYEGTGIGLALVAELASLHGGRAVADSRVGQGSTVTVTLPRRTAHAGTATRTVAAPPSPAVARYREEALRWSAPAPATPERGPAALAAETGAAGRSTVLVADDNADLRRYLTGLLEPGVRVLPAADGQEALDLVRAERPDLVLADVMMPRLDGWALLHALRADPATAGTPVVLLSARAGEQAAIEGLAAGADDYLVKPFSSAELLARVRAHLDLAAARTRQSRRLADLARATAAINEATTPAHALQRLADTARELIGAHQAAASLVPDGSWARATSALSVSEKYAAWRGRDVQPDGDGVYSLVCRDNAVIRMTQAELEASPAWRDLAAREHPPMRGWLAAPLRTAAGDNLGLVHLTDRFAGDFTADDEAVLVQLAEVASAVLQRVHLLQQQTDVALTLQRSILGPATLPGGFAVHYEPAADTLEVGGDWYDVMSLADGRFAVVVGDVVGRGLDAAAVMGQLRSAARALLLEQRTPGEVLTVLDTFATLIPGATCSTVFCALIDPRESTVRYSSAGHLPALLADADGASRLLDEAQCLPLAVGAAPRREVVTELAAGTTLLLYTDGLVERRGEDLFDGVARAAAALVEGRALALDVLVEHLCTGLLAGGHDDDVAFLLYRRPTTAGA